MAKAARMRPDGRSPLRFETEEVQPQPRTRPRRISPSCPSYRRQKEAPTERRGSGSAEVNRGEAGAEDNREHGSAAAQTAGSDTVIAQIFYIQSPKPLSPRHCGRNAGRVPVWSSWRIGDRSQRGRSALSRFCQRIREEARNRLALVGAGAAVARVQIAALFKLIELGLRHQNRFRQAGRNYELGFHNLRAPKPPEDWSFRTLQALE
jgi:hypothetical protein